MERSASNSSSLGLQLLRHPSPSEISGWSLYVDDLMAAQDVLNGAGVLVSPSSSMISDAASSCALPRNRDSNADEVTANACKKLKRTRSGLLANDDPLEDTASSHLSSRPKINETDRKMKIISSKELRKEGTASQKYLEELIETESEMAGSTTRSAAAAGRSYEQCSELRKRGLCLVPVSMFIHYLK